MTCDRRIVVILMLLIQMGLQQLTGATDNQLQKYNVKRPEQSSESITNFPVNPYVFSAEDYDVLQNAETFQRAQSIVTYEPQKIDTKKTESTETFVKNDLALGIIAQQPIIATQQSIGDKYNDISWNQSRPQLRGKPSIKSRDSTSAASKVTVGTSEQSRAFDKAATLHPYVSSFSRNSKETGSSLSSTLMPKLSTLTKLGDDGLSSLVTNEVNHNSKSTDTEKKSRSNKEDRNSGRTTGKELGALAVEKIKNRNEKIAQFVADDQEQASLIVRSDRIPRPFGFTTKTNDITETLIFPTRINNLLQNPTYQSTSAFERAAGERRQRRLGPAAPLGSTQRTLGREETATASPNDREHASTYETVPLKRNHARQKPPIRQTADDHSTATADQRQPGIHAIPKRRERLSAAESTIATREKESDEKQRRYRIIPLRRNSARYAASTEQPEDNALVEPNERLEKYTRTPLRRKEANEEYEEEAIPPTVSAAQQQSNVYVPEWRRHRGRRTKPASYNDVGPDDDRIDNKRYSYSHVERYVEPLEAEPAEETNSYKVTEDIADIPDPTQPYAINQMAVRKQPEPDLDDPSRQPDAPTTASQDYDYDQAKGQNVQQTQQVAKIEEVPDAKEDLVEEADHHHQSHHKPKEEHHEAEESGSEEHHELEHHENGDKGEKDYKEFDEHDEGKKGHHKKEDHNHHYDEKEGKEKESSEEHGFREEHEKGEEGEKKSGFNEKGKHQKGHSTKGEHVIHKKDEFEKKTEFFDEFHDEGDMEKKGVHHGQHEHKKGGHYKKGHHHHGHHKDEKGEKGKHEKGHHHHDKKGHHEDEGHHHHHEHQEKHGKKGEHGDSKHWHRKHH